MVRGSPYGPGLGDPLVQAKGYQVLLCASIFSGYIVSAVMNRITEEAMTFNTDELCVAREALRDYVVKVNHALGEEKDPDGREVLRVYRDTSLALSARIDKEIQKRASALKDPLEG